MLPVSPAPTPASTRSTNSPTPTLPIIGVEVVTRRADSSRDVPPTGAVARRAVRLRPPRRAHGRGPARTPAGRRRGAGAADDVGVLEPAGGWRAELATAFELHRL